MFQYEIYVQDQGITLTRRSDVTVQINVIRDTASLIFTSLPYNRQFDESLAISSPLVTVRTSPSVRF